MTQYEVQPAPDIKVSRIEALADDLAMALAARSLRIEAPIPGKSAVGIEIPNKDFNVVALRRILEEVDFKASGSTLTFALGRDVAGKAQAVDLAKMPHLLIAGATGSGKSVMVNALITSLLCEATPDDVRMILMDLKRVELAAYNGLPHLLVPVITEPERAKAALKWAVNEMEARYRRLAGATRAQHQGRTTSTRADPEDRMPYIVIIIDELADLMMREGKNVEDPIVRLAQKARADRHPHGPRHAAAVGQRRDRPDQGQLPEPDRVRDGVPDRLADDPRRARRGGPHRPRRHALPAVGPAAARCASRASSSPTPRSAGSSSTGRTRSTTRTTTWQIIETGEESASGVARDDLDRRGRRPAAADAIEVIREYDRASASLLQRRLKVGYARAARMIDQLEARGYIGAFDGSNARAGPPPRRDRRHREGPTTTLTGIDAMTTREQLRRAIGVERVRRRPRTVTADPAPEPARAAARRARAQGRRPLSGRARHEDPGALPRAPSSAATTGAARARSTRRASCATTRSTSGSTPTRSCASGGASAATAKDRSRRSIVVPRPIADAAQRPDVLAGDRRRRAADGRRRRVRRLPRRPAPALRQAADDRRHRPATAVIDVDESTTTYTPRGHRRCRARRSRSPRPAASRTGRPPTSDGDVGRRRRPPPRPEPVRRHALDPETGKQSEATVSVFITVPVPRRSRRRR